MPLLIGVDLAADHPPLLHCNLGQMVQRVNHSQLVRQLPMVPNRGRVTARKLGLLAVLPMRT